MTPFPTEPFFAGLTRVLALVAAILVPLPAAAQTDLPPEKGGTTYELGTPACVCIASVFPIESIKVRIASVPSYPLC